MTITVEDRLLCKSQPDITWIEPGEYDLVRFFSTNKVIIDVTQPTSAQRQLAIVSLGEGVVLNDEKNKNNFSRES